MLERQNRRWISRSLRAAQARLLVAAGSILMLMAACDGDSPSAPQNDAPTASFTSSCTDLACTFSGAASSDPDGSISSYAWDFGDGSAGTGAAPSHTYAAAGTYEVRLTVTDNQGATGVLARDVTVTAGSNQAPTASFTASCSNLDCMFDASGSNDPDGSVASYMWDFGDGNTDAGQNTTHTYGAAGTFTVTLTATDDQGATGTSTQSVTASMASSGISQLGLNIVGEAAGDRFGRSVALSDDGSRVVAGALQNAGGGVNSGHVRAFDWNGSAWVQVGQDLDGIANEFIGGDRSVDISGDGNRIVIGSWRSNSGFGKATIFELTGGTWVQVGQTITSSTQTQLGNSVSLSTNGSRVALGARVGDGRVEVHELVGNTWTQMGSSITGPAASTFGHDVSLSSDGTRVLGSAPGGDGQLLVYDWNGTSWAQVGNSITGRDGFGLNAAMSSDGRRVVGYAAFNGDYAAAFELVGGTWVQMGPDFPIPGAFESYQNVGFSASGDRLALGNLTGGPNAHGAVEIYDWSGSGWSRVGMDVIGDHVVANLGWSISMSADGGRVAAGMPGFNDPSIGAISGAVKVFEIN